MLQFYWILCMSIVCGVMHAADQEAKLVYLRHPLYNAQYQEQIAAVRCMYPHRFRYACMVDDNSLARVVVLPGSTSQEQSTATNTQVLRPSEIELARWPNRAASCVQRSLNT